MGETGTVVVHLNWANIGSSSDPVEDIRQAALYELRNTHDYDDAEIAWVEDDTVLTDSAKKAYVSFRRRGENLRNEKVPVAKYRLRYTRPKNRNWMDRERKE